VEGLVATLAPSEGALFSDEADEQYLNSDTGSKGTLYYTLI
jgi:hypothetical protein